MIKNNGIVLVPILDLFKCNKYIIWTRNNIRKRIVIFLSWTQVIYSSLRNFGSIEQITLNNKMAQVKQAVIIFENYTRCMTLNYI